jgi:polar amino acid transport system substrate-binding protein
MRTVKGVSALAFVAVLAAACTTGGASPSPAPTAAATPAPTVASVAPATPSPTPDACAPENLTLKTAGKLTIGADNPAYPPYFQPSENNPDPWELGDPTNGMGFESATAYAVADAMGFAKDSVTWVVTPFNNAIQPGPKDFDIYLTQVSYSPERAQAVDLSDGYYNVAQSLVALKDNKVSSVTSIAGLKDFQFGAQIGTTSLKTITDVIAPTKEAKVYDSNDAAIEALKNGQIDGIVVDLPTAFYVTAVQVPNGTILGQFPSASGGEHFGMVFAKDSSLTGCVDRALDTLKANGTLKRIQQQWLAKATGAPVLK